MLSTDKFDFCGYKWFIRTTERLEGPGPNRFAEENAFVADDGLHLKIQQTDGVWSCGEIVLDTSLGYGSYSIKIASDVSAFDRNVVFGFFLWADDPAYSHREIDIEIASWGKSEAPNGQFVVQPHDRPERKVHFVIADNKPCELGFSWSPGKVVGYSHHGPTQFEHRFTRGVPAAKDETVRMNLWLFRGEPPSNEQPVEVIISEFRFTPHVSLWTQLLHHGQQMWRAITDRLGL